MKFFSTVAVDTCQTSSIKRSVSLRVKTVRVNKLAIQSFPKICSETNSHNILAFVYYNPMKLDATLMTSISYKLCVNAVRANKKNFWKLNAGRRVTCNKLHNKNLLQVKVFTPSEVNNTPNYTKSSRRSLVSSVLAS